MALGVYVFAHANMCCYPGLFHFFQFALSPQSVCMSVCVRGPMLLVISCPLPLPLLHLHPAHVHAGTHAEAPADKKALW